MNAKKYDKQKNKMSVSSRAGQSEYRLAHRSHFGAKTYAWNLTNPTKAKKKAKVILTRWLVAYSSP